ncbi:MAG: YkgJ family cysteine cluster protein [Phycisphaerales bacterium]
MSVSIQTETLKHVHHPMNAMREQIAQETAAHRPRCDISGRCCHFEKYGHRMYVTALEAAYVVERAGHSIAKSDVERALREGNCPFLRQGQCSIHAERPLGCRIFFCDSSATAWQNDLYERMHQRMIALHEEHDVEYNYGEWRAQLMQCVPEERGATEVALPCEDHTQFVQLRIERAS